MVLESEFQLHSHLEEMIYMRYILTLNKAGLHLHYIVVKDIDIHIIKQENNSSQFLPS